MCGRFTQAYTWQEVYEFYNLSGAPRNLQPNYNVAPTQAINVIVARNGERLMVDMRWGLVPVWWKKPLKDLPSTFNARSETAAGKPMFRSAFRRNRCLVPATGFYEWKRSGGEKQPYLIRSAEAAPLTFAGLWDRWRDPESGEDIHSCTVLTTEANSFMSAIHTRMPVILTPDRFDSWLGGAADGKLAPRNDNLLAAHPVGKAVGNVRNNGPELLEPVT
ncbi:MAG: SOS response-associated peptidase [Hyphomicrobiales bacterium]